MFSIIIPAHNEETVIERCLSSLKAEDISGTKYEIIVACNGCSDNTADIVRKINRMINVIEIDCASKTEAINAAEAVAKYFPRIYIDADVIITLESVMRLVEVLLCRDSMICAPMVIPEISLSSWIVKDFYSIWTNLPYNKFMVGTGVYALSQQGRERFKIFPSIISDDGYVRSLFKYSERVIVSDAKVIVVAPRKVKDLIKVKTRSRLGGYELLQKFPKQKNKDKKRIMQILKSLPFGILLPRKLLVYFIINIIVRLNARKCLKSIETYKWDKDESTRIAH
jgi:glycosyltransferase involved in cell wall biosynthesis